MDFEHNRNTNVKTWKKDLCHEGQVSVLVHFAFAHHQSIVTEILILEYSQTNEKGYRCCLSVLLSFVFFYMVFCPSEACLGPIAENHGSHLFHLKVGHAYWKNLYCLVICLKSSRSTVRDCFRHWSTRPSPIHKARNFKQPNHPIFRTGNGIRNRLGALCKWKNSAACHLLFPHDRVGHYRRTHPRNVL